MSRAHRAALCLSLSTLALASAAVIGLAPQALAASNPRIIASPSVETVLSELNSLRAQNGLSPAQLTSAYSGEVNVAVTSDLDPVLSTFAPGTDLEYGLWGIVNGTAATPSANPAGVVDNWVFDDGWQGANTENLDCTSPNAPGCDGHRNAVLSTPPRPGDTLEVDIAVIPTTFNGSPAVSVAMVMAWGRYSTSAVAASTPASTTTTVASSQPTIQASTSSSPRTSSVRSVHLSRASNTGQAQHLPKSVHQH